MTNTTWRAVFTDGREVAFDVAEERYEGEPSYWRVGAPQRPFAGGCSPESAATDYAHQLFSGYRADGVHHIGLREIVPPGAPTAAERDAEVARLRAETAQPDPVDALNAAVTAAIFRAEGLAREGSADAASAYAEVARYEAALSALHPADTVEGVVAREGVRLAAVARAREGASE
jgi:hypothetical protein